MSRILNTVFRDGLNKASPVKCVYKCPTLVFPSALPHFADAPIAGSVQGNSSHLCMYGASAVFCKVCTLPVLFLSCQHSRLFLNWLAFGSWALPPHSVKGPGVAGLGWAAWKRHELWRLGPVAESSLYLFTGQIRARPVAVIYWAQSVRMTSGHTTPGRHHEQPVLLQMDKQSRDTLSPHGSWVMELGSKAGVSGSEPRSFWWFSSAGGGWELAMQSWSSYGTPVSPLGKALLSSV